MKKLTFFIVDCDYNILPFDMEEEKYSTLQDILEKNIQFAIKTKNKKDFMEKLEILSNGYRKGKEL